MQDYLIVKGQIDPIENEKAPKTYKANEWQKLDRTVSGFYATAWENEAGPPGS